MKTWPLFAALALALLLGTEYPAQAGSTVDVLFKLKAIAAYNARMQRLIRLDAERHARNPTYFNRDALDGRTARSAVELLWIQQAIRHRAAARTYLLRRGE